MFNLKSITTAAAIVLATSGFSTAQDAAPDAGVTDTIMSFDGTADETITAVTGWHICSIVRTGAGWGNHYVALTCPNGPFTNKWHIMRADQKDAMLATALSAATAGKKVQVNIGAVPSGTTYRQINALYFHN